MNIICHIDPFIKLAMTSDVTTGGICVERTNCGIGSRWFWNWPSSGEQIKSRRTGKHKRQSWSNTFCWIQDYLIFKRPFRNWPRSTDSEHKFDHPPPSPWWSVKIRCTDLDFRDRETGFAFWCICTSHMVFFLLFSFSYFLRLNRLLFAGVCLVGASRAPRASLTRAQQRLNNYSTEYNLSPISSNRSHICTEICLYWRIEDVESRRVRGGRRVG